MAKTVLITGAGGSIGSEVLRQSINDPLIENLLINDISEYALFSCYETTINRLKICDNKLKIIPILGDIGSNELQAYITEKFKKIDLIYNIAAYKHVGISMIIPDAYYKNNVRATSSIIEIARKTDAKIVHVSTDKAVHPNNHMGFSKRLCELQYFSKALKNIEYKIVRFGNVLNSSGSVIPIFKEQIANGGPVTVTDPLATRYLMSISEAVSLLKNCLKTAFDCKINVLNMGEPVLIDRLARNLIEQEGFQVASPGNTQNGIEIKYIGLRNGEKLHEELAYEKLEKTNVTDILTAPERNSVDERVISRLMQHINNKEYDVLTKFDWKSLEFK